MKDELFIYRRNALLDNLCKEWDNMWRACKEDKEKLVRFVMIQQSIPHFLTYCHQGKGLSKDYILKVFGDYVNGKYVGIDVDGVEGGYRTELYVAYNDVLTVSDDVFVSMWSAIPSLEISTCKATKIYCGCSSEMHLVCGGYNSIVVMLFDNSTLYLDDVDEDSTVTIYRYSNDAKVEVGKYCLSDKIKMFDKELRL